MGTSSTRHGAFVEAGFGVLALARRRARMPCWCSRAPCTRSRHSGLLRRWPEQEVRRLAEGLLEVEALARARGDLLAARREILLERLGVARELRAELVDLAAQIARRRLARVLLRLVARRAARASPARSQPPRRRARRSRGSTPPCRAAASASWRAVARARLGACASSPRTFSHVLAVGGGLAQHARLLVRELLDLAADLGAERAAATLERLELARVARDLALEARSRARRDPTPARAPSGPRAARCPSDRRATPCARRAPRGSPTR